MVARRLLLKYIQCCTCNFTAGDCLIQILLVYNTTAGTVYDHYPWFHLGKGLLVKESLGISGKGSVYTDIV